MADRQVTVTTRSSGRVTPALERVLQASARPSNMVVTDIAERSGLSPNTVKNSSYLDALLAGLMRHAQNVC